MKQTIALLFLCAFGSVSFAADVQILHVQAAAIDPALQATANTLVRSAVSQTGNTPVETVSDLQLRTTLLKLDQTWVVVAERIRGGKVEFSTQLKAGSADELDMVITRTVQSALGSTPANQSEEVGAITTPETESLKRRKETRKYGVGGGGPGIFHGMKHGDMVYDLRFGALWEVGPHAAITVMSHDALQLTSLGMLYSITVGGRWYASAGRVTPFLGAGLGMGMTMDRDNFRAGFAGNAEGGLVVFRTSAIQMEFGAYYDIVLDGLDGGAPGGLAGAMISVNY